MHTRRAKHGANSSNSPLSPLLGTSCLVGVVVVESDFKRANQEAVVGWVVSPGGIPAGLDGGVGEMIGDYTSEGIHSILYFEVDWW